MEKCDKCGLEYESGVPHAQFCSGVMEGTACDNCGDIEETFRCAECGCVSCSTCGDSADMICESCAEELSDAEDEEEEDDE
jgi:hypothetical protein